MLPVVGLIKEINKSLVKLISQPENLLKKKMDHLFKVDL